MSAEQPTFRKTNSFYEKENVFNYSNKLLKERLQFNLKHSSYYHYETLLLFSSVYYEPNTKR